MAKAVVEASPTLSEIAEASKTMSAKITELRASLLTARREAASAVVCRTGIVSAVERVAALRQEIDAHVDVLSGLEDLRVIANDRQFADDIAQCQRDVDARERDFDAARQTLAKTTNRSFRSDGTSPYEVASRGEIRAQAALNSAQDRLMALSQERARFRSAHRTMFGEE